jgi:ABC-type transporter Mla MlaB component
MSNLEGQMAASPARTATVAIRGPLHREDLPKLFEGTCETLSRTRPELLLCDVSGVAADAVAVDALSRLALAARRHGCGVLLRGAEAELCELVRFIGLADILRTSPRATSEDSAGLSRLP